MPRPSKEWEKKYGNRRVKNNLLVGEDDILSASKKLASGVDEAQAIILQAIRHDDRLFMRLLDMDDMQMYGQRIVKAYHEWSDNNYDKLMKGVKDRDKSLVKFIAAVQIK